MADIRQTDTAAQTGMGIPDDARGPGEDDSLELELARTEKRLRLGRTGGLFGDHPDGVGPTLGQDLGRPNPGVDMNWDDEDADPPT